MFYFLGWQHGWMDGRHEGKNVHVEQIAWFTNVLQRHQTSMSISYWTTRGYANLDDSRTGHLMDWSTHRLDNSRTGQLTDAIGDFACLVFLSGGICKTTSCPVRDLSSPRVD